MKRISLLLTALAVMMYLSGVSAFPQGGSHGGGPSGGHGGTGTHGASGTHGKPSTSGGGGGKSAGASSTQLNNVINNPDSKLNQKLTSLLPAGTDLKSASSGFKNLGQFVAAVHVYNNLGLASKTPPVSFTDFAKAAQTHSLGAAIKQFDPTANARSEAKKGNQQAKDDTKGTAGGS